VKVLHESVAGIDVHKDMIKVAIRSPGDKPWTRKTEVFEFRTFYGALQEMARELRRRGVTHVVMEASGVYTEPVYHALAEPDFTEVIVVNPAHVKALKGHKTDARDCARMAELLECGLLRGSFIPSAEQKEVRDTQGVRSLEAPLDDLFEHSNTSRSCHRPGAKLGSHSAKGRQESGGVWTVICPARQHFANLLDSSRPARGLLHTEEVTCPMPVWPTSWPVPTHGPAVLLSTHLCPCRRSRRRRSRREVLSGDKRASPGGTWPPRNDGYYRCGRDRARWSG
jgi:hypothetical protein